MRLAQLFLVSTYFAVNRMTAKKVLDSEKKLVTAKISS